MLVESQNLLFLRGGRRVVPAWIIKAFLVLLKGCGLPKGNRQKSEHTVVKHRLLLQLFDSSANETFLIPPSSSALGFER